MNLKLLGYWKSGSSSSLPDPALLVDPSWDESVREIVANYLEQGQIARQFMGASTCRICQKPNGSAELTDGEFIWPSGLGHYVIEHSVRLPDEFVAHVFQRLSVLEAASIDTSWWEQSAHRVET